MQTLEETASKKNKAGMNRLAASSSDRDAWITVITRLATRAPAGLELLAGDVKLEENLAQATNHQSLSDTIRESLYMYIIEDFRKRIDIAVAWLCEEWYNDKIQTKIARNSKAHYEKWVLRVLDGIVPYLDAKDKVLTRFLSEIPDLSVEVLERVKGLARDPIMVNLSLTSLLYLVMMRPPAREIALDAVEAVWRDCMFISVVFFFFCKLTNVLADDDARPMAGKYLTKWRPGFADRIAAAKAEVDGGSDAQAVVPAQNGVSITT